MRIRPATFLAVLALIFSSTSWSADFAKGQEAYNVGDYETALTEWQPLAEAGDANGQFGMGLLYANGFGVPLDDSLALKWYRSAADQGHAAAQYNIAVMYANGWGVPQSDEEAFKWYSLAAEQGVTEAQVAIGKMYWSGFGVAQDKVQALKWLSIASELGDSAAPFKRDELASKMSPEESAESDGLVRAWMESYRNLQAKR